MLKGFYFVTRSILTLKKMKIFRICSRYSVIDIAVDRFNLLIVVKCKVKSQKGRHVFMQ